MEELDANSAEPLPTLPDGWTWTTLERDEGRPYVVAGNLNGEVHSYGYGPTLRDAMLELVENVTSYIYVLNHPGWPEGFG